MRSITASLRRATSIPDLDSISDPAPPANQGPGGEDLQVIWGAAEDGHGGGIVLRIHADYTLANDGHGGKIIYQGKDLNGTWVVGAGSRHGGSCIRTTPEGRGEGAPSSGQTRV